MRHMTIMAVAWAVAAFLNSSSWGQVAESRPAPAATSPAVLLEKAIYTEETVGDLDAAMKVYQQIVDDATANRSYVAQATYRLGMCYLKKGQKGRAAELLRKVSESYGDQRDVARQATAELDKLAGVEKRKVNKKTADFPPGVDLSTPESACAAWQRANAAKDSSTISELSLVRVYPEQDFRRWADQVKIDTLGVGVNDKALAESEIVEVLVYKDDLADVITFLPFPEGKGRDPYSSRGFGRINGQWKNLGEDRLPSLEAAEATFSRKKEAMWANFQSVRDQREGRSGTRPADKGPVVLRTNPPAFANNVDPNLDKITVTFDRPMMDKSWSWTGGGDTFPQRTGEMSYDATRTTCTMPAKLQPGKAYWVGVNSPSHQNFKSVDGAPARRYVILFATKSADGKPTPLPEDLVKQAREINTTSRSTTQAASADKKAAERLLAEARQVGQMFLQFLQAGQVEQAFALATPEYRRVHPKGFAELSNRMDFSGAEVADVLASRDNDSACVVLSGLVPKGGQDSMLLGLGLLRDGGRFLIRDVDELPNDGVKQRFIAGFQRSLLAAEPMRREYVDPEYVRAAEELSAEGWRLWNEKKLPDAEGKFKTAVALDPTNANAWNGLGWAQLNQGKPVNAQESFQKGLAVDPKLAGALNGLGWIAKSRGKTDEAMRFWRQAVELLPSATAALSGLAGTLYEQGQYEEALEHYQAWLKIEPDSAQAKAGMAKAETARQAVVAAVPVAQAWLTLVDEGKNADSWEQASKFFRAGITKDKWLPAMASARRPLGRFQSRKLASATYMTSVPGSPDGQYVVIQYEAVFENKKQAVETVTPMLEKGGKWRVSGYYVK